MIVQRDITIQELFEMAREKQLHIELEIEPDGYGSVRTKLSMEPWEKWQASCPYGTTPVVNIRGFTPEEINDILVKHGQCDEKFKLGETIRYSPSEIRKILVMESGKNKDDKVWLRK